VAGRPGSREHSVGRRRAAAVGEGAARSRQTELKLSTGLTSSKLWIPRLTWTNCSRGTGREEDRQTDRHASRQASRKVEGGNDDNYNKSKQTQTHIYKQTDRQTLKLSIINQMNTHPNICL